MGQTRTYNPLNEGYSGLSAGNEGYSGQLGYNGGSGQQVAPQTIKPLQSAIIKPATPSNPASQQNKGK